MKIAVSGSNGYIASNLIPLLEAQTITVVRINRQELYDVEKLAGKLSNCSVVINLAGAPILQRWTISGQQEIRQSRAQSTRNITEAINKLTPENRPKLLISASAVGIYSANATHTEKSTSFAPGFLGSIVSDWENATENLSPEVRKVIFRIGIVIGKKSKTIRNLLPVFKIGFGGKIASGKQPFPFVHINDATAAIQWAIENSNARGTYNLVAPDNIDNKTFTYFLAKTLHRPSLFTVPSFILKMALGKASSLLTESPQAYPERLLDEGFRFSFPDIKSALEQIVR